jgi:hypothetical protein
MIRTPPLLPLLSRPQRAFRTPPAPGTTGWDSGSAAIALSMAAISVSVSNRFASRSYRLVANILARTVYTIRNFRIASQWARGSAARKVNGGPGSAFGNASYRSLKLQSRKSPQSSPGLRLALRKAPWRVLSNRQQVAGTLGGGVPGAGWATKPVTPPGCGSMWPATSRGRPSARA